MSTYVEYMYNIRGEMLNLVQIIIFVHKKTEEELSNQIGIQCSNKVQYRLGFSINNLAYCDTLMENNIV